MSSISIESGGDLGPDFEPLVLSCILNSKGFYDRFGPAVQPGLFTVPETKSLIDFVKAYYTEHKKIPSRLVLDDIIKSSNHRNPGGLLAMLDNLPPAEDEGYVSSKILGWLKWRAIDSALSDVDLRNDPSKFAKEIEKASRVGDELVMNHSVLGEDADEEAVRKPLVPTPWDWLNERLGGGPEKGDFGVVITVINGGKTTLLVNIAMHAVAMGMNVVFLTFEDGETKIKRRMMQWINGWTTDRILSDLANARSRRDRFLKESGGAVHIKQLKTRRTSVDDAIAFVRNLSETSGRPVDLVITDYADRYKSNPKFSEPRHGLREIYEDCKFLSTELEVVHWTASQAAKVVTGKDVVGIEHGSESSGKFESCDLAIGFGQTMEDQKRGTMTMHTSKVRDGKKSEITTLMADFETQRIFERGNVRMTPKKR